MLSPDVGATDPGPPEVENFTCHFFVISIRFLFSAGNSLIRATPRATVRLLICQKQGGFGSFLSNNFNSNYIIARRVPNSETG